jgi:kynureninase
VNINKDGSPSAARPCSRLDSDSADPPDFVEPPLTIHSTTMSIDFDHCRALDAVDPLAAVRERFVLPATGVYLAGNSLGPRPVTAAARVAEAVEQQWGVGLVRSWGSGWFDLPLTVGAKLAAVLGAAANDVVVTDTISINLFKVVGALRTLRPDRPRVLVERGAFPTDRYVIASAAGNNNVVDLSSPGELAVALAGDPTIGVVALNHVDYVSSERWDVAATTRLIHDAGALAVWDLAHSAGAMDVDLAAWDVDAAVGCTYKYLNGGPGAPGFIYLRADHAPLLANPLPGWWGHDTPFAMQPDYRPAAGVRRFLCGTQPVLSMVALDAALDAVADVDWADVRAKSVRLTTIFATAVDALSAEHGIAVAGPRDPQQRGSHIAVDFANAYELVQALAARGVIGDFRPPTFARFGFNALYASYADAWTAGQQLTEVITTGEWREPRFAVRGAVT